MDIPYQLDLDKNTKIQKPRDLANDLNNDVYLYSMHMYICKYVLVVGCGHGTTILTGTIVRILL